MNIYIKHSILLLNSIFLLCGATNAFAVYKSGHNSILSSQLLRGPNIRVLKNSNINVMTSIPKPITVSGIDLKELEKLLIGLGDINRSVQSSSSIGSDRNPPKNPPKNPTPKTRIQTETKQKS